MQFPYGTTTQHQRQGFLEQQLLLETSVFKRETLVWAPSSQKLRGSYILCDNTAQEDTQYFIIILKTVLTKLLSMGII